MLNRIPAGLAYVAMLYLPVALVWSLWSGDFVLETAVQEGQYLLRSKGSDGEWFEVSALRYWFERGLRLTHLWTVVIGVGVVVLRYLVLEWQKSQADRKS